jgi:hypothetical protein
MLDRLTPSITDATARAAVVAAIGGYGSPTAADAPAMFAAAAAVPSIGADNMLAYKQIVREVLNAAAPGDNSTAEITRAAAIILIATALGSLPVFTKIRCVRPLKTGVNTGTTLTEAEAQNTAVQMILDDSGTSAAEAQVTLAAGGAAQWRVTKDATAGTYTVEKGTGTGTYTAEPGTFAVGDTMTSDVAGLRATILFQDPIIVITPTPASSAGDPFVRTLM